MRDLIERLEKASGRDRGLDADIYAHFEIPKERAGRIDIDHTNGVVGWWPKDAPYESAVDVPRYTASLDAAVALVERVLRPDHPHMTISLRGTLGTGRYWQAEITWPSHEKRGHSSEPAIALCLALLRAKEARAEE